MSQPSQLSFPVSNFFPKENYQTECKENPQLTPMYLIACGQSNKTIKTWLDKKDPHYVAQEKYRLTALTVAVWKENVEIILHLLFTKNVDPSPQDSANLIPLNYAVALEDITSMTLLQQAMKVTTIITDHRQIFPEWEKILNPSYPKEDETVFYYQNDTGKIVAGNEKQFVERTGAEKYYDGVVSTKQDFINFLASQLEKPIFRNYNPFTQKLAIQANEMNEQKHLLYLAKQGEAGDGVHALVFLERGKIYGTYGGELQSKKIDSVTHYQFDNVQGERIRNLPNMINDGFPNTSFFEVPFENGIAEKFLVPLRDIEKREPLYWDYGFEHSIKLEQRVELNEAEMEEYFKANSPTKLFQKFCKLALQKTSKSAFKAQAIMIRLLYIFNTPTAMLHLCLKNIVEIEEIKSLMKEPKFQKIIYITDSATQQIYIIRTTINLAESLLKILSCLRSNEVMCKGIQKSLLNLLHISSFHSFRIVAQYALENFPSSYEKWVNEEKIYKLGADAVDTLYKIITYNPNTEDEKCLSVCKEKLELLPKALQKSIVENFMVFATSRAPQTLSWLKKYENILDK